MLLPPPKGACQECAGNHEPDQPHNAQSLYYQYRMMDKIGRWPTWQDALAHCTPELRALWKAELERRGAWSEPENSLTPEEKVGRRLGDLPTHSEKQVMKPGTLMKPQVIDLHPRRRKRNEQERRPRRDGAGLLFVAEDTGRFLLSLRSGIVSSPYTWSSWGGSIREGEAPAEAAVREADEESRILVRAADVIPMFVFRDPADGFRYHNFLVRVPREETPRLDRETEDFGWFDFGRWPAPLHPGMDGLLADAKSVSIMKKRGRGR